MRTIRVDNLSKRYQYGDARPYSLRELVTGIFDRTGASNEKRELWALKDVSFEVNEGDTLGVIGNNGAGKSTLLKILSRVTKPTKGRAEIRGRVGSLLEVGTGFHAELSGRENIYLNGAILGMRRNEIAAKFDEIVAFSDIETFLDTPVKHYSSGMYMRLAFAIAAHLEPEVLIVDEVLAVGDIHFQKKCLGKMSEVSRSGRTVLFVSHNLGSLGQICNRGLLLDHGQVVAYGGIGETIDMYLSFAGESGRFVPDLPEKGFDIRVTEVAVVNKRGEVTSEVPHDKEFFLEFAVSRQQDRRGALFCVAVLNKNRERVFTEHRSVSEFMPEGISNVRIRYEVPGHFIAPNHYSFLLQIFLPDGEMIQSLEDVCHFTVVDTGSEMSTYKDYGYVQAAGKWHIVT